MAYETNESKFLSLLGHIFNGLSPESKSAARKWLQPLEASKRSSEDKPSPALATILQVESITLPPKVQHLFDDCKQKPSSFWNTLATNATFEPADPITTVASNVYIGIQSLWLRREWDTIVWRYYVLFFYDLALLIGNGQTRVTKKLLQGLVRILRASQFITDDAEVIETNLLDWCAFGHKYWKICNTLDNGALFLLPQLIGDVYGTVHLHSRIHANILVGKMKTSCPGHPSTRHYLICPRRAFARFHAIWKPTSSVPV